MLSSMLFLKQKFQELGRIDKRYKALRKHLHTMPVGFPSTVSGVELRILRAIFTPEEAEAALNLDYRAENLETIVKRALSRGLSEEDMKTRLASMDKKGAVMRKERDGESLYCLHPFIIGFFEMQVKPMNAGFYRDTRQYVLERYALEYLTTSPSQMRIIPVEKSLTPEHKIATYDELRAIIERAGDKVGVTQCICRKGRDLLGDPCKATDRRETCLLFWDFHDIYVRNGWGRSISKEEALEIAAQSEKDGLVLQPSNEKDPGFICSCCSCCCGVLEMFQALPRPADHVASNYYVSLDEEKCVGCGICEKRCQTRAFTIVDKKAVLDSGKCIGCGLCVAACKTGALELKKKQDAGPPPEDAEALLDLIKQNRKSELGKIAAAVKGFMGIRP